MEAGYGLTTFSPSGKLPQLTSAMTATNEGKTSLGIKAKNGVVIAPPRHADEVVLVFLFAPLYDCKTYLEHDSSKLFDMSACVQSSGSFSAEKALLDHFAPRADVILFDIGLHPISSDRRETQHAFSPDRTISAKNDAENESDKDTGDDDALTWLRPDVGGEEEPDELDAAQSIEIHMDIAEIAFPRHTFSQIAAVHPSVDQLAHRASVPF